MTELDKCKDCAFYAARISCRYEMVEDIDEPGRKCTRSRMVNGFEPGCEFESYEGTPFEELDCCPMPEEYEEEYYSLFC